MAYHNYHTMTPIIKTHEEQAAELRQRMHNLPTELFNDIYDLVMTPDETEVKLDRKYKPPIQLQIDRLCRKRFSEKYYKLTHFTVPWLNPGRLVSWLTRLTEEHRASVRCINVSRVIDLSLKAGSPELTAMRWKLRMTARLCRSVLRGCARELGAGEKVAVHSSMEQLRFRVNVRSDTDGPVEGLELDLFV
ncbi:hypothetical protein CKM354_000493000 [Cercospora kikuchii]|uniref:Uncharacterized protein n=1 Tax=Cercospora kikuchii TaxID=84275 RepID=A0A9P3CGR2_9PEZI|nr:uncharacterized protein CKM354_000493000 [Cercospora kikuchii]GIZ41631.1 hypothetical protein CKM354_000493000 [Cercospora kikuchii]